MLVTFESYGVSQNPVEGLPRNLLEGVVGGSEHGVLTLALQQGGETCSGKGRLKQEIRDPESDLMLGNHSSWKCSLTPTADVNEMFLVLH